MFDTFTKNAHGITQRPTLLINLCYQSHQVGGNQKR